MGLLDRFSSAVFACCLTFAIVAAEQGNPPVSKPAATPAPVPAPAPSAEPLPDAAALRRLARRAIQDAAGVRMQVGPVTLKEKLADGSYLVDVMLEDGRRVKGRLFRNRQRYRITVDRRDLFSREKTVVIQKN